MYQIREYQCCRRISKHIWSLALFNLSHTVHTLNARASWHTHASYFKVQTQLLGLHFIFIISLRACVYEYINILTLCREWAREPVIVSFCIKPTLFPIPNEYYVYSVVWACVLLVCCFAFFLCVCIPLFFSNYSTWMYVWVFRSHFLQWVNELLGQKLYIVFYIGWIEFFEFTNYIGWTSPKINY